MSTEIWIYNEAKFPAETHLMLTMLTKQFQNLDKSNDGNIYGDTEQDRWMRTHTVLSGGPVHTLLTVIWERNKIITNKPPVHTVTASKSFENGAKLKRNAFQSETNTSLSLKYSGAELGPIKVKCQSEDSFIDFVHNVNFQNDPLIVVSIAVSRANVPWPQYAPWIIFVKRQWRFNTIRIWCNYDIFSHFLFNSWQQKIYNFHINGNVKQQNPYPS